MVPPDFSPPSEESAVRAQKFTVTLKSIMKVYYETVAWLACTRTFSSMGRETEVRGPAGERGTEREGGREMMARWWGLQFVAR